MHRCQLLANDHAMLFRDLKHLIRESEYARQELLSHAQSVLGDLTLLGIHGIPALVNESLSMQPIQRLLVLPMAVHLSAEQLVLLTKLLVCLEERVTVGV